MRKIILASGSPQRQDLLRRWGLKFEVCPSDIKESTHFKSPHCIVKDLSLQKALNVLPKYPKDIIIASDTIVVLDGKIIGKPKNFEESKQIIESLNGSLHKVYTGVSIIDGLNKKVCVFFDAAQVKMKRLDDGKLSKLFGNHTDKAGSYAIQDKNDEFVEKFEGDYYTIVGLPHIKLKLYLKKFNVLIH
jgi:septum formation protein